MFIMAPFAAGLQLYWVTNNLLTLAPTMVALSQVRPAPQATRTRSRHERDDDDELAERARKLFAGPIDFLKSAPGLKFLPTPAVPEIAFAGRSNVGKSSLINAVTNRKTLARASNTPGRTQELNYFEVGEPLVFRLVDMPGYGFAEAPKDMVKRWRFLINDFLRGRQVLKRALVLVDARHGLKDVDRDVMKMLDEAAVSYHLVLTKADKVKPTELGGTDATGWKQPGIPPPIRSSCRPPAKPERDRRVKNGNPRSALPGVKVKLIIGNRAYSSWSMRGWLA